MRNENRRLPLLSLRFGVLILAVAFMAIGGWRQEHLDVLQKAVTICLECIGIG